MYAKKKIMTQKISNSRIFSIFLRFSQHRKISSRKGRIAPAMTLIEAATATTHVNQYIKALGDDTILYMERIDVTSK